MAHDQSELLQGTLELLILKTLSLEPLHGWGISHRIQQMSRDVFQVNQGSVYPALQRMHYVPTPSGDRELARERSQWERSVAAVNWVLNSTGGTP